ncbi:MAG: biotin--[acetyl-CoA-carboxylase] ligase, partial [Bacteroidales bacterium]|nr:biotin--[acetyl-CoA-carboxylase] ligase [Bacteroidales bacterium]
MQIVEYKEVVSTNSLIKELIKNGEITENTAILSGFQKNGRGQGENVWFSDDGKNILASVFYKLDLPVKDFFTISMATALSILELMREYGIETKLKWPNDIYFGDKK